MKTENSEPRSHVPLQRTVANLDAIDHDPYFDLEDINLINVMSLAARSGDVEICKQLLKAGFDVNVLDDEGSSPLHVAVEEGHVEVVELLLDHAAGQCDVNMPNALGQTPLMIAVILDDLELVKILYKAGANLNDSDKTGKTALLRALQESSEQCARYLIKQGCDVNVVDHLGQSALFLSINSFHERCEKIVKSLCKKGYDVEKDKPWLREAGLDVDHIESDGILKKLTRKLLKHVSVSAKNDKVKDNNSKHRSKSFRILNFLS